MLPTGGLKALDLYPLFAQAATAEASLAEPVRLRGNPMTDQSKTDQSNKAGLLGKILHLICLCASLALFISIASPADDDLQQESALCHRHQSATLLKANHPADVVAPILSCTSVRVAGPGMRFMPAWVLTTVVAVLLPDRIHVRQRGDLPPPRFLV